MIKAYREALDELGCLPLQYVEDEVTLDTIEKFIESTKNGSQCGFWVLDHIGIVPRCFRSIRLSVYWWHVPSSA